MPAVGLSISDEAITALEIVRRKGAFAVGRFGRRALPPGAVSGGELRRKEEAVAALRSLKEELHLDFVNASLSEEKAYLFKTRIPRVPRKEIRSVLNFKLEDNVPVPAAEATFDYSVITGAEPNVLDSLDVVVTVLPQKVVEAYAELFAEAGLTPLSFEIEAQAIARAVIAKGDRGAYLIVNFGDAKTGLFNVSDETVYFTSTAPIGSGAVTDAVLAHLSLHVPAEEVSGAKRAPAAQTGSAGADPFHSFGHAVLALKGEVNKLLVYWRTHHDQSNEMDKKIGTVILTGRRVALQGIDDYLSLSFGLKAEAGNVWRNICSLDDYIPPILFEESLEYAAAAGLALPKGH